MLPKGKAMLYMRHDEHFGANPMLQPSGPETGSAMTPWGIMILSHDLPQTGGGASFICE